MSKQRLIDETQLLQMHEGQAQHLLNLWQAGRIDLDCDEQTENVHLIEPALTLLCDILDRSIRARNQQVEENHDPRNEYGYDPDRL